MLLTTFHDSLKLSLHLKINRTIPYSDPVFIRANGQISDFSKNLPVQCLNNCLYDFYPQKCSVP